MSGRGGAMADMHRALRAIARRSRATGGAATVAQVGAAAGVGSERASNLVRGLVEFGLAERLPAPKLLIEEGYRGFVYRATDLGRQVALLEDWAAGRMPTRRCIPERLDRAWRAMRVQGKFTTATLADATLDASAPKATAMQVMRAVAIYCRRLQAAGVLAPLPHKGSLRRWVLVNDLGPIAPIPQPSGGRVWDPNGARYLTARHGDGAAT